MEALWPGLFVAVISFFGIRAVRPKPAIVAEQRI
jgi:hypothetical protein